jgi:hypothetical protein
MIAFDAFRSGIATACLDFAGNISATDARILAREAASSPSSSAPTANPSTSTESSDTTAICGLPSASRYVGAAPAETPTFQFLVNQPPPRPLARRFGHIEFTADDTLGRYCDFEWLSGDA